MDFRSVSSADNWCPLLGRFSWTSGSLHFPNGLLTPPSHGARGCFLLDSTRLTRYTRPRARIHAWVSVYVCKCTRVLHVGRARICEGSGHVQGGGTAPFAKLTALDRGPGILYAFLDLRPAILRWISRRKRSSFLTLDFFFIAFSSTYHV